MKVGKLVVRGLNGLYVAVGLMIAAIMVVMVVALAGASSPPTYTEAERMALRVDALLDRATAPEDFVAEVLDPYWVYEVGPYFQYEGITNAPFRPNTVVFEPQLQALSHNHILGYTYCERDVFINIRVINPISAWYGWERNPLAVLVHEMIHTLGADYCDPFDSAKTESSTQTATLETLAAVANGGNSMALYSLMLELKDMAMDVALEDALANDNLDGYREFRAIVDPEPMREARFEKSMRYWAHNMPFLRDILDKYSVMVFENVQAGELSADIPTSSRGGDGVAETVPLNDLQYVLDHLEDMVDDGLARN